MDRSMGKWMNVIREELKAGGIDEEDTAMDRNG